MAIPQEDLDRRMDYHPPETVERRAEHESVRSIVKRTAEQLNQLIPDGREKALVITGLEEVMFWANAAVARQDASTAPVSPAF